MADAEAELGAEARTPSRRMPFLVGLVLALLLGGGGFYAVWSGLVLAPHDAAAEETQADMLAELPPVTFVPIDPLLISLGPGSRASHLRFQAQLEVDPMHQGEVAALMPRVVDVLNSYLRAVEPAELEDPAALTRLRSQMLRRVQIVVGEGRVRDLLVMEFVLN